MSYTANIYVLLCCVGISASAQVGREGEPLSWNIQQQIPTEAIWNAQPALDLAALIQEDEENEHDKSAPYRFAQSHEVNYTLTNSGRWTNLANGDRIWMLGIECSDAYSVGISFSTVQLPEGANIFIYSENRSSYIGPITSRDNRLNQLMVMPPVNGDKVIIEYYEPFAYRGEGKLQISSVAQGYRDIQNEEVLNELICLQPLADDERQFIDASSSILMMIVDHGQRIATGILVNNSSNDATPYVITAQSALLGQPSSWLFLFDVAGSQCFEHKSICLSKAICGAQIIVQDHTHGMALLKLRAKPKHSWSAYYSGFNLSMTKQANELVCIHNAMGMPQSICHYDGQMEQTIWNGYEVHVFDSWQKGATLKGSVGSPVFNSSYQIIGIYLGGESTCENNGVERIATMHDSWLSFKEYLDPFDEVGNSLDGIYPIITPPATDAGVEDIFYFPNPARDWIYIQNKSEEPISRVEIRDATGRLCSSNTPLVPTIDTSYLPEGIYTITFYFTDEIISGKLLIR